MIVYNFYSKKYKKLLAMNNLYINYFGVLEFRKNCY